MTQMSDNGVEIDPEYVLQRRLDLSRNSYEDAMGEVRTTYFRQLDMLHAKLVREQNDAVDKYHETVRERLTKIAHDLRPLFDDVDAEMAAPANTVPDDARSLSGMPAPYATMKHEFFSDDDPVHQQPITFDPAILDQVDEPTAVDWEDPSGEPGNQDFKPKAKRSIIRRGRHSR